MGVLDATARCSLRRKTDHSDSRAGVLLGRQFGGTGRIGTSIRPFLGANEDTVRCADYFRMADDSPTIVDNEFRIGVEGER